MKKIDSVCVLTLGTSAQTVRVSGLACMVQNNSLAPQPLVPCSA